MQCPKCGGPMWDNRDDKKNPKAPDYKCKDKTCTYKQEKDGTWSRSAFQTGAWEPKTEEEKFVASLPPQQTPTVVPEGEPDWEKITEGKVRHGIVCSLIEAGKTKEEIYRETPGYVRYILTGTPL